MDTAKPERGKSSRSYTAKAPSTPRQEKKKPQSCTDFTEAERQKVRAKDAKIAKRRILWAAARAATGLVSLPASP